MYDTFQNVVWKEKIGTLILTSFFITFEEESGSSLIAYHGGRSLPITKWHLSIVEDVAIKPVTSSVELKLRDNNRSKDADNKVSFRMNNLDEVVRLCKAFTDTIKEHKKQPRVQQAIKIDRGKHVFPTSILIEPSPRNDDAKKYGFPQQRVMDTAEDKESNVAPILVEPCPVNDTEKKYGSNQQQAMNAAVDEEICVSPILIEPSPRSEIDQKVGSSQQVMNAVVDEEIYVAPILIEQQVVNAAQDTDIHVAPMLIEQQVMSSAVDEDIHVAPILIEPFPWNENDEQEGFQQQQQQQQWEYTDDDELSDTCSSQESIGIDGLHTKMAEISDTSDGDEDGDELSLVDAMMMAGGSKSQLMPCSGSSSCSSSSVQGVAYIKKKGDKDKGEEDITETTYLEESMASFQASFAGPLCNEPLDLSWNRSSQSILRVVSDHSSSYSTSTINDASAQHQRRGFQKSPPSKTRESLSPPATRQETAMSTPKPGLSKSKGSIDVMREDGVGIQSRRQLTAENSFHASFPDLVFEPKELLLYSNRCFHEEGSRRAVKVGGKQASDRSSSGPRPTTFWTRGKAQKIQKKAEAVQVPPAKTTPGTLEQSDSSEIPSLLSPHQCTQLQKLQSPAKDPISPKRRVTIGYWPPLKSNTPSPTKRYSVHVLEQQHRVAPQPPITPEQYDDLLPGSPGSTPDSWCGNSDINLPSFHSTSPSSLGSSPNIPLKQDKSPQAPFRQQSARDHFYSDSFDDHFDEATLPDEVFKRASYAGDLVTEPPKVVNVTRPQFESQISALSINSINIPAPKARESTAKRELRKIGSAAPAYATHPALRSAKSLGANQRFHNFGSTPLSAEAAAARLSRERRQLQKERDQALAAVAMVGQCAMPEGGIASAVLTSEEQEEESGELSIALEPVQRISAYEKRRQQYRATKPGAERVCSGIISESRRQLTEDLAAFQSSHLRDTPGVRDREEKKAEKFGLPMMVATATPSEYNTAKTDDSLSSMENGRQTESLSIEHSDLSSDANARIEEDMQLKKSLAEPEFRISKILSGGQLIEATIVDEECERATVMASAVEIDHAENHRKNDYFWVCTGCCCMFLIVAVAITISVAFTVPQDDAHVEVQTPLTPEERFQLIKGQIRRHGYDTTAFENEESPESKALHWLGIQDLMFVDSDPRDADSQLQDRMNQRFLLAMFYYSMTQGTSVWEECTPPETGEPSWCLHPLLESFPVQGVYFDQYQVEPAFRWLSENDECRWGGVTCEDGLRVSHLHLGKCFVSNCFLATCSVPLLNKQRFALSLFL